MGFFWNPDHEANKFVYRRTHHQKLRTFVIVLLLLLFFFAVFPLLISLSDSISLALILIILWLIDGITLLVVGLLASVVNARLFIAELKGSYFKVVSTADGDIVEIKKN